MSFRLGVILLASLAGCVLAACGGEADDNAVEAREENVVTIDGMTYRAVLFRQLNPRVVPDRSLVEQPAVEPDVGLYAVFLRVCNDSDEEGRPTDDIVLEDAFGQTFRPLRSAVDPELNYQPRSLAPESCVPASGSTADETFSGAALVFGVPFESAQERPMVLEIRPRGGGDAARIQLDL